MDTQTLINTGISVALVSAGWVFRELWGAIKAIQKDIHDLEVDLPRSYVTKDDFNITMKHIEDMFQRIYDKLDGKADKRGA